MFTIPWDVKEPTHYSKRVWHEVPGVVAVLCESIAGPHQLIAAKKTQPAQSNKRKKERKTWGHNQVYTYSCIPRIILTSTSSKRNTKIQIIVKKFSLF